MMDDEAMKGCCPDCGMFIYADKTGHRAWCPTLVPHFKLDITLGNAAVQKPDDIAALLEDIADQIRMNVAFSVLPNNIRDINGNACGTYRVTGRFHTSKDLEDLYDVCPKCGHDWIAHFAMTSLEGKPCDPYPIPCMECGDCEYAEELARK
jgi:hypothetical protein